MRGRNGKRWKVFIVSHRELLPEMYEKDTWFSELHYGVLNVGPNNTIFNSGNLCVESQKMFSTFQNLGKWWAESEGIYNYWLSGKWKDLEYIGFIHYDIELRLDKRVKAVFRNNVTRRICNALKCKNAVHISFETHSAKEIYNQKILADITQPNKLDGDGYNCYDFILNEYNQYFSTSYTIQDLLEKQFLNLCSCFLIDVKHFDEMMKWWETIIKSKKLEVFDTHHQYRIQGGLAERFFSVYLAFAYEQLIDFSLIHHANDELKKGKTHICVIRNNSEDVGFFSFFNTTIGSLKYNMGLGYQVIVDDQKRYGWDFIFDQPCGKELESLDSVSKDNIVVDASVHMERPDDDMEILTNNRLMQEWHDFYEKNFSFTPEFEEWLSKAIKGMFPDGLDNVIGVLCRGTDYLSRKPHGHPIQPKPEELFFEIDKLLIEENKKYSQIYLATEDRNIFEKFDKHYHGKLVCNTTFFVEPSGDEYISQTVKRKNIDVLERNKYYFLNIYILSKCNALVAGRTSGTVGAMVMSDGYEDTFLWNSGRY